MASISTLRLLLQPLPRGQFERLVKRLGTQRYVKSFTCWSQLVALVVAQLWGAQGLRPLQEMCDAQGAALRRLGAAPPRRSTFADACALRPLQWLLEVVVSLMGGVQRRLRHEMQELVYLLDSSPFLLKGLGFEVWTAATRSCRMQGLKLHLLLNLRGANPCWVSFTRSNVNDITAAVRGVRIERGAVYVFDKGYCHYNWWWHIDQCGACFVTRFHGNAALVVVHELEVPEEDRAVVLRDEIVCFKHKRPRGGRHNLYSAVLRRISIAREGQRDLVLATNDLDSPASEIALLYKDRWQVELFFKWIKQHLNIKHFMGRSQNAVKTQLLGALIAYLLLLHYRAAHGLQAVSLWMLLGRLRTTLFDRAAPAQPPRPKPAKPARPPPLATVQLKLF